MESQNTDCEQPLRLIAANAAATPTPQTFIGQAYADADAPDRRRSEAPSLYDPTMIEPGSPAPDFTLQNQDDESVSLSDHRGHWVVLYFYPKADTPGCTVQACGVRDRGAEYAAVGAVVLGVSPDPVAALAKFAQKYGLPFTLLADPDHAVAERYGVWVEKSMYGRKYMVSPKTHDDEVLAAIAALS
jgi:peroxiredoxin Q/BCP